MRPRVKKGQCCRDNVSKHPLLVVSIQAVDEKYYGAVGEFIRRKLNCYKIFKIYGISLVDGSLKSFKVSKNCQVKKLQISEAYLERSSVRKENNVK